MKIMEVTGAFLNEEGMIEEGNKLMTPEKFIDFCTKFALARDHNEGMDNDCFAVQVLEVFDVDSVCRAEPAKEVDEE